MSVVLPQRDLDEQMGLSAAHQRRKAESTMETHAGGTSFQEGDYMRIKRTRQTRRINTSAVGVVYVRMHDTIENIFFADYVDKDAYFIELVTTDDNDGPIFRALSSTWDNHNEH